MQPDPPRGLPGVSWTITVDADTSAASFLRLLWWLRPCVELAFYDQYFPGTRGDPGVYVFVQRKGDRFVYSMGNHGWSRGWQPQSPELIAAWMVLNLQPKPTVQEPLRTVRIQYGDAVADAFRDPPAAPAEL